MLPEKDVQIISYMRQNSRQSLKKVSAKIHIPISTIYDKLKTYENGLIKRHTCLLDFGRLGFSTRANILVKIKKEEREEFKGFLEKNQNINSVYKINNGFDFLFEAVFRNMMELESFVEGIDERFAIKAKQVYYIIDEVKREGFMAEPVLVKLV